MPMQAHPDGTAQAADHLSRRLWRALEPYHAVVYFIPETRRRTDALGLKGGWMSYFGTRAAPLGPVPAEVVAALFYNFHPDMVRRAIPDAWSLATPEALMEARLAAVDEGLRRLLGPAVEGAAIAEAAELASEAARATATAGRPLAAANAALPWPGEGHLRLWHAATILREARGDGHVTALVVAGLSPCEALVTASAAGGPPAEMLRTYRKWSQAEWDGAAERLRSRGWLDEQDELTEAGRAGRAEVERRTDELIEPSWDALGAERAARLESLLLPIRADILAAGGLPIPNPAGIA
jgi:Helix-turn-helix family